MKKLLALLITLALAVALFACTASELMPEDITLPMGDAIAQTEPAAPPRPGAVMPPLQGGPMLYTFPAAQPFAYRLSEYDGTTYFPVFHLGLVNDMGELVAQPRYTRVDYMHDLAGRVVGVVAQRDREFTHYSLQGVATVMPFEAAEVMPVDDGRHWIVRSAGPYWDDGTHDGLFDLQTNTFVIPLTEGLQFWSHRGAIFGHQRETYSFDSALVRSFRLLPDGTQRDFPQGWRVQGYFPETGWYEVVEWGPHHADGFEIFIIDRDFNIIPDLRTQWHIDSGFGGGNYLIVRERFGIGDMQTWVDRDGNISSLRYGSIRRTNSMYIAWNYPTASIYDGQLNRLHSGQVAMLWDVFAPQTDHPHFIASLNAQGDVQRIWNTQTGREVQLDGFSGHWRSSQHDGFLIRENNQWREFNASQFLHDNENTAWITQATQQSAIVMLGREDQNHMISSRYIAVDWHGNEIDGLPLFPYPRSHNAGEQGPHYWWVELDDRRGFVGEDGQWLFVHEE